MYRKSYEVVGYAFDGALYCVDCHPLDCPDDAPVFLDNVTSEDVCDDCGTRLDGED